MRALVIGVLAAALAVPGVARAGSDSSWACWNEAAQRYHVNVLLLYAVARVETKARAGLVNRNRDGSADIGVMQINTWWLPKLAQYGITATMLATRPCLNVNVGAWILSQTIARYGLNWRGVGAYNATTPAKRARYARRVVTELKALKRKVKQRRVARAEVRAKAAPFAATPLAARVVKAAPFKGAPVVARDATLVAEPALADANGPDSHE